MQQNELIVPIITPRKNGGLDQDSLRSLTNSLLEHDITGLLVLGTNGEFQYLTLNQKLEILEIVAETVAGRIPLYVCISADTFDETNVLIEAAEKCNAAAIVFTPEYGKESITQKTETILRNGTIPIILYNNQHITNGKYIPLSYIEKLKKNKRVIGIKDSSGDLEYLEKITTLRDASFAVLHGEERNTLDAIKLNIDGLVSGSSNVFASKFVDFMRNPTKENFKPINVIHAETGAHNTNYIKGLKMELVKQGMITTSEMWS